MNALKNIFIWILDSMKGILWRLLTVGMILLLMGGYMLFVNKMFYLPTPDSVVIRYTENLETYTQYEYTKILASEERGVIKEWSALTNEAAPKRNRVNFTSFSKEALFPMYFSKEESFPMYVIEFQENTLGVGLAQIRVFITENETVIARVDRDEMESVKYDSINPFHAQAAELIEMMEKNGKLVALQH